MRRRRGQEVEQEDKFKVFALDQVRGSNSLNYRKTESVVRNGPI